MKQPVYNSSWSDEIKALYRHDLQEIWDPSINRHMWNQYHNQLEVYQNIVRLTSGDNQKRILDVGCAQGTLALKLAEAGYSVVALELRKDFIDYAKSRYVNGDIRFVEGNVLELDINGTFDIIFANQIIEHLVYPDILVFKLKALLKSGGQLVVTTPSGHYFKNKLPSFSALGDPNKYEHLQFTADADGHFFAYREDEMSRIFADQGFDKVKIIFFETPIISGHFKIRHLHRFVPASVLTRLDKLLLATPLRKYLSHQMMIIGTEP